MHRMDMKNDNIYSYKNKSCHLIQVYHNFLIVASFMYVAKYSENLVSRCTEHHKCLTYRKRENIILQVPNKMVNFIIVVNVFMKFQFTDNYNNDGDCK